MTSWRKLVYATPGCRSTIVRTNVGDKVMIKLIDGEAIILGAPNSLCLTTHRVHWETQEFTHQRADELFLEHISYQALRMWSQPIYLILAAASLFLAGFGISDWNGNDFPYVAVIASLAAIALFFFYLASRQQVLIIAAGGGAIRLAATKVSRETLDRFLTQLALAKADRNRGVRQPGSTALTS